MNESPKAATTPIRVAVIGYGYWGPNLVRNFSGLDACVVTAVCDLDEAARATAGRFYPWRACLMAGRCSARLD